MRERLLIALMALVWGSAAKVYGRLAAQARARRLALAPPPPDPRSLPGVTVLLPVLNERSRLPVSLSTLTACGPPVSTVAVIDTGSTDGTPELVRAFMPRDPRLMLIEAGPPPPWWANGKAWGLRCGMDAVDTPWVLMTDADVRWRADAPARLIATAVSEELDAIAGAPQMDVSGPLATLHASMLASLIFRVGLPGALPRSSAEVLANGQVLLARADRLRSEELWRLAAESRCEDVTLLRTLYHRGAAVGSVEVEDVEVAMYESIADAWQNWPRSLALRDGLTAPSPWLGLAEAAAVQALPLALAAVPAAGRAAAAVKGSAAVLFLLRAGVAWGMSRAYPRARLWAALAPLADVPVSVRLWQSALARRHRWRGRLLSGVA